MSYDVIARRWARAVFEIGKESGEVGELQRLSSDIGAFAETFSRNAELAAVLDDPLVPEPEREAVVSEIADRMGLLPAAKGTLRLLARKRRLIVAPGVVEKLRLVGIQNSREGVEPPGRADFRNGFRMPGQVGM